jgi:hypothetical protein
MKSILSLALLFLALGTSAADGDGWISLFNGKDLDGWKVNENPDSFKVADGAIVVNGKVSHLFYDGPVRNHSFQNFELKLEIMAKKNSNSGVYIHTEFQDKGFPKKGYEIQVNNTHSDAKKTAGVYGIQDNFEAPAKDDEWFTMRIKVEGKRLQTFVNDKPIADYTEPENPGRTGRVLSSGTFALQGHDPGSEVHFKNIFVKPLP